MRYSKIPAIYLPAVLAVWQTQNFSIYKMNTIKYLTSQAIILTSET